MSIDKDLMPWVSDGLLSLIDCSSSIVVQYVVNLSQKSSSPGDLFDKLVEFGFPSSVETRSFVEEAFRKTRHEAPPGISEYRKREREAALFAKQQSTYQLVEPVPEEEEDGRKDVRENAGKKRYRRREREVNDFDDEDNNEWCGVLVKDQTRQVKRRVYKDDDSDSEEQRDRIEKEKFEQSLRDHDEARTKKLIDPKRLSRKEEEEEIRRSNAMERDDIETLRRVSRREYLKKREQKKLEELRDDLEDEQFLFQGVKLSEPEDHELRYKKKIYELVKKRSDEDEDVTEYRIPEAYDDIERSINQEKRFSVAMERYREPTSDDKMSRSSSEYEAWEKNQIGKGTVRFGSKNSEQESDEYSFVFENQINFIRSTVSNGENSYHTKKLDEDLGKLEQKNLEEERKNLPIFRYREELLKNIEQHQVLIVEAETGSGKTTQIPQFLHEAGYTKRGKIGCTQPRRVAAMSVAARVSREMGVKLGHEVGYSIRFEDCTSDKTVIKYMTDGVLLREFLREPDLASYSVLIIDEAHERTLSTDILFGLVKDISRFRTDLKVIISSATLDSGKFSEFFDLAPAFPIEGRRFPVEIMYTKSPEADYLDAAIVTILQIHVTEPPGDVLLFLTGQEEIEMAEETLKQRTRGLGSRIAELIICPIYANLPTELQSKIFEPTPPGARKVVLATNIAETSLTIDGIKYVIDPGYSKVNTYNPRSGMESLLVTPISKASAKQRAGRSGRTGPGKCFRLYTEYSFNHDMPDNSVPEIQRKNIAHTVLIMKSIGIDDLFHFDFMDPPPVETLIKALEQLFALGALNKLGELTTIGRRMAEFPVNPEISKMIVASDKYKCADEILSIAAMLSVGNSIFYRPKDKQVHADNARLNFHTGDVGDHVALLNVYNSWRETNYSSQWCYEHYVQVRSMKRARDIRDQLEELFKRVGLELTTNLNDLVAIKKAITSGFFLNAAKLESAESYRTIKHPQTVHIHPSSGLANVMLKPKWVLCHELVMTSREYMRQVTELKPEWLLEIAPHYYQLKDVEDPGTKKISQGRDHA